MNKIALISPLTLVSAMLIVVGCGPKDPPTTTRELRKEVAESVKWSPANIPADQNGWDLALKATELPISGPPVYGAKSMQNRDSIDALYQLSDKPDTGDLLTRAEPFLKHSEPALKMIADAVKKPNWSVPPRDANEVPTIRDEENRAAVEPCLGKLKNIAKAVLVRASIRLKQGKKTEALDDFLLAHTMGQRLAKCHHTLIYHFAGTLIEDFAERAIQRSIKTANWSVEDLTRLSEGIGAMDDSKDLIASLKYEFESDFLRYMAGMPSPKKAIYLPEQPLSREMVTKILDKHPDPFDRRASVRDASKIYAEVLQNLEKPWGGQKVLTDEIFSELTGIPDKLVMLYHSDLPADTMSETEIAKLRTEAKAVKNPVGKILIVRLLPKYDYADRSERRSRAFNHVTQIVLAIGKYRLATKKEPASLDDLVKGGYLKALPEDPFSAKPFRYDAARRVIWSVGPNRTDEGGKDIPYSFIPTVKDYVWATDGVFTQR